MMDGLFVSYAPYLQGPSGGVQNCTREYVDTLRAAGIDLRFCPFEGDRRFSTRFLRRFTTSPYFRPAEPALIGKIAALIRERAPRFIFLNQVSLAVLAPQIRAIVPPECRIVLLSHGLESTDLLHHIRGRATLPIKPRIRPTASAALGNALLAETQSREHIDLVFVLSPFDAILESWIGAKDVLWLPRSIRPAALSWAPQGDRLGFVGTLDHTPNLAGLIEVLDALERGKVAARGMKIRVVGRPRSCGAWLAQKYPHVEYVGDLNDTQLETEAATWNAFLHPLFCLARGASTKLATAIAWQIPIVTTSIGRRGYEWRDGELTIGDDANSFATACLQLLSRDAAAKAQKSVVAVAASSPSVSDIGNRIRDALAV